ncbi:MAG: hypothetical protein ABJN95_17100 [Maribacter sp.]|uniref:hypothetical protein n=1 Tax=Maribacter sp. TaxID=1897614 RepID=UPI003297861F
MANILLFNQGNANGYLILAIVVILLLLSPAIVLCIIGLVLRKKKPKTSKTLFIIAGVYLLIGLGICGGATLFG